ncbi:unnamed protein product [Lampetra planeri]
MNNEKRMQAVCNEVLEPLQGELRHSTWEVARRRREYRDLLNAKMALNVEISAYRLARAQGHGVARWDELFELEHQSNRQLSWALRAAGLLLMYLAIRLMVNIVHTLVDWLPLVRDLVNLGLSVFAAIGAVSLSVTVVALSWLAYHPAHAALLLLAAVTVVMVPWRLVWPQARPAQAMRSKKE